MTRSAIPMKALRGLSALSALALVFGCSSDGSNDGAGGTGSSVGGGGAHNMGAAGASVAGAPSGGAPQTQGGTSGVSGGAGGASAGSPSAGSPSSGGSGGAAGGGVAGAGGGAAGSVGGPGGAGGTGGAGTFDPCPASDACKILPLGDSITWGINYGGGYRIKLFTHTSADSKKITFVGYDVTNPPSASVLSALGSASSMWSPKHEGHSGWTIQQDDDLVTGKSTANNDGVNYTGKKVVADFTPNIILVHLGTNDMYGSNPGGAPGRLGTLIDHVVADAPNALVVVASIIPFPSGAAAVTTFNAAVPGQVKTRADAGKHVIYLDMFSALKTSDLSSDGVHPNEGGYEKMAVAWYGAIKTYLH